LSYIIIIVVNERYTNYTLILHTYTHIFEIISLNLIAWIVCVDIDA